MQTRSNPDPLETARGDASAIVVAMPELDPVVRPLRNSADRPGVPALPTHVTILYPWVPPPIPTETLDRLAEWASQIPPFDFALVDVAWFDDDVVWLRPEPSATFSKLTAAVHELWPEHPPYEGAHDPPIPHVTIGEGGDSENMRRVADIAVQLLPIRCRAAELWVMEGTAEPAHWWHSSTVPLTG